MSEKHVAWVISAIVGFTSLGMEILWIRVFSFASGNTPQAFGLVLGVYLFGIMGGAWAGQKLCLNISLEKLKYRGAYILLISGMIDVSSPFFVSLLSGLFWWTPVILMTIFASAASKAVMFPIVHHLGSNSSADNIGKSVSHVYFMNIIGSTIGPIVVGFWALDHFSSQNLMVFLGFICILLSVHLLVQNKTAIVYHGISVMSFATIYLFVDPVHMLKKLASQSKEEPVSYIKENRHGVVHTLLNPYLGDVVLGGNIYDGRINTDLIKNSNGIDRVYLLSALRPNARRVLVIGLSGGSWVRVISAFPQVEHIEVVELNPSYIELVGVKPEVAGILSHEKIKINIDDGRRWLRGYVGEPFDLIVMNTTFHWRAYASNLLSAEFLGMVKQNLATGGIVAFNATGSPDAFETAASVFKHAYRWDQSSFIYSSEQDFRTVPAPVLMERVRDVVSGLDDEASANPQKHAAVLAAMAAREWKTPKDDRETAGRALEVITDQNMLTEYKYGRGFIW